MRQPLRARCSRKRLYADVLILHSAVRIVALKPDRAVADYASGALSAPIPIQGLSPLHDFLAVQSNCDRVVLHNDVLREPLVVLDESFNVVFPDILHMIEAATLDRITMGVVNLYLEAFLRKATILKLGMKVDAAV